MERLLWRMRGLEPLASCRKGFSLSAHCQLVPLMHMGGARRAPPRMDKAHSTTTTITDFDYQISSADYLSMSEPCLSIGTRDHRRRAVIACSKARRVRALRWRKAVLSLLHPCLTGSRSGEYEGRYSTRAPHAPIASAISGTLWAGAQRKGRNAGHCPVRHSCGSRNLGRGTGVRVAPCGLAWSNELP
jgi:hypothetical protein